MKLEVSQKSFDIVKCLLSNAYIELLSQRKKEANMQSVNKKISDTAELIRSALKEIGVFVSPTHAELDKEGNFK